MSGGAGTPPAGAGWEDLARAALHPAPAAGEEGDAGGRLLVFELDGAPYALPVERVREIVRMRPVTRVPRAPEDVCGVISLRGEIVQVVDLRRRLGLAPAAPTRASRVVVTRDDDAVVAGLLVDAVREVLAVPESALRLPVGEPAAVQGLCAHGGRFLSVVDLDRVLDIHAER